MIIATQRLYQPIGYQAWTEIMLATCCPWFLAFLDALNNQRIQEDAGKED